MLIQIVHAHPLSDSYDHALFRAVVQTLEPRGHEVIATDLYREDFDPLLSERGYFAPVYAADAAGACGPIMAHPGVGWGCSGSLESGEMETSIRGTGNGSTGGRPGPENCSPRRRTAAFRPGERSPRGVRA
jgi:hypothetical protein